MKKMLLIFLLVNISLCIFAEDQITLNIEKHLNAMASDKQNGRAAGSYDAKQVANYILDQFDEIGLETEIQSFSFNDRYQNVIGIIPSKNDKYIVIGAHYDHLGKLLGKIYNGADDNASGVSAIIEISRLLSKEELKYGIIFIAFDAEEIGLKGSKYFSRNNEYSIELMLSLDMVGHLDHEARLVYEGASTIKDGENYIHNSEIENVSVKTYPTAKNSGVLTDTFYFSKKNIPAINIFTGLETSDYHLPSDDIETLDIDGIALIVKQVSQFIINVQDDLEPSNINLYGNHKQRFGIAYTVFSDSTEFLISFFGMSPCSYSILGDHYFKYGIEYESKEILQNDEINYDRSINIPLSFALSIKTLGLEMLFGIGAFADINIDSILNDSFQYSIGPLVEYEFKQFDNISFLNHLSIILEVKGGYKNLFQEGLNNNNFIRSTALKFGISF